MKHLVVALLLAFVSGSACAQESAEYRTCSDKAKTQLAMNGCASDEAARADAQLNEVYRTLLQKGTDQTALTKIKLAERAWIAYRDAYIDAMYPAENKQAEYGSLYRMQVALLRAKLTRTQVAALQDLSQQYGGALKALPEGFASVLREVKAKTRIPILLPSALPDPVEKAKQAVVDESTEDEYTISLYYERGIGDAGFAASFMGEAKPDYSPEDLPNVERTPLDQGIVGFFRPVSCGGSCAPANLWWQEDGRLYQIQLKLPSITSEQDQQKAMTTAANSAIAGGTR